MAEIVRTSELTLQNWRDFGLDANIAPLVLELTRWGFITKSSCGGHEHVKPGSGQRPAGEWYITFMSFSGKLDTLIKALDIFVRFDRDPRVSVTQLNGVTLTMKWEGMTGTHCVLEGTAPPEQVRELLAEARAGWVQGTLW